MGNIHYYMRKRIPINLTKITNSLLFIAFVVVFAFTFILIFSPYGSGKFEAIKTKEVFAAHTAIVSAIGLVVLLISRMILHFVCVKREPVRYGTYVAWVVVEIIAIAMFCNLYAWLVGKVVYNCKIGYFGIIGDTLTYCVSILTVPYIISTMYFELMAKDLYIERFRKRHGITAETDDKNPQLLFNDDKGNLKLSVNIENLYYIEAADNYVNICYQNKDRITKFILRNSLKNIETMDFSADLVRCHRSYIVNFKKVKVLKKEKTGLFIELDDKDISDLPVSKTYAQMVLDKFNQ